MAPKLKCHRIREEHDHTLLQRFERKHGGGGANKVKVEQLILSRFESASIRERARLDLTNMKSHSGGKNRISFLWICFYLFQARLCPCHAHPAAAPSTPSTSSSSSTSSSEVETTQISYPTIVRHRSPRDPSSQTWAQLPSTPSSWLLISVAVALLALASLPDVADAWPLQQRGHSSTEVADVDEGRERSLAALVVAAARDALPRVHYRQRRRSRRSSSRSRRRSSRAPRNLNTCGNEPAGTPVSECNNIPLHSINYFPCVTTYSRRKLIGIS